MDHGSHTGTVIRVERGYLLDRQINGLTCTAATGGCEAGGCVSNRNVKLWSMNETPLEACDQCFPFLLLTGDAASARSYFLPPPDIRAQREGTARQRIQLGQDGISTAEMDLGNGGDGSFG